MTNPIYSILLLYHQFIRLLHMITSTLQNLITPVRSKAKKDTKTQWITCRENEYIIFRIKTRYHKKARQLRKPTS